jgi:CIC family chloride channel protein
VGFESDRSINIISLRPDWLGGRDRRLAIRLLIGFIHNVAFSGNFSTFYDANIHTPESVWGMGIILVPVLGGLIVVWLIKNYAPEAKGHGVPEVISAIYYKAGHIGGQVSLIKALASSISIGTGGSLGREGPIVQICASFSSALGKLFKLSSSQRILLISCGASGGIAATFNAPLAGLMFAIELLMVSVNSQTILAVAMSTVIAANIGRILIGPDPAFTLDALHAFSGLSQNPASILIFLPFGAIMALFAMLFVKSIYWFEDFFEGLPVNEYIQHIIGTTLLGALIYLMYRYTGHYYVQGVGYATISSILVQAISDPVFMLMLFFAKLLATGLTIGSGGSGGVFSPTLFLGASMGGAIGHALNLAFPHLQLDPVVFSIVGMASMVSASTSAPLTAALMTYEMTRDYNAILPIMLCVSVAYAVRRTLMAGDIYTLKLLRRGEIIPKGLVIDLQKSIKAGDISTDKFRVINRDETFSPFDGLSLVVAEESVMGVIRPFPYSIDFDIHVDDLIQRNFIIAKPESTLQSIMHDLKTQNANFAVITYTGTSEVSQIAGIITEHDIAVALDYAHVG